MRLPQHAPATTEAPGFGGPTPAAHSLLGEGQAVAMSLQRSEGCVDLGPQRPPGDPEDDRSGRMCGQSEDAQDLDVPCLPPLHAVAAGGSQVCLGSSPPPPY